MATSNILAVGTSAATSSDVTLAAGASANLVLMASSGNKVPVNSEAVIYIATSGSDTEVGRLTATDPTRAVAGPGTYRVARLPGKSFGVDSNTV